MIADKVLALIRAIYNWAGATGRLDDVDPTRKLRKRNASRPRVRILSEGEIFSFWFGLDASNVSHEIRDALRLQLLLGARISELVGAAKSEIDLERRVWTIPAERTKPGREHRLPLPPLAASILKAAMERAGNSPWLFPSRTDHGPMRSKSAMRATLRLQKLQQRPSTYLAFENWCKQNSLSLQPATPEAIAGWIRSLPISKDGDKIALSDLKMQVSVIVATQRAAGHRINQKASAIAELYQSAISSKPPMGAGRPGFSTHDLRRTIATGLGDIGVSDEIIGRLLNHAPRTVTGRHYNHARHFQPLSRALDAWEQRVLGILQRREPETLPILHMASE